eukprot:SAG22_NODE_6055_length_909_cov_0.944444_1_plen_85_part_00
MCSGRFARDVIVPPVLYFPFSTFLVRILHRLISLWFSWVCDAPPFIPKSVVCDHFGTTIRSAWKYDSQTLDLQYRMHSAVRCCM